MTCGALQTQRARGSAMPRQHKPPSLRTISNFIYFAVLAIGVLRAFVAVRALFA